jgi:predicted N-acetyltransferase YhbS
MWYYRRLANGFTIMHTRPEHAPALEELQRTCFPTLADAERFKAANYRKHLELFPDGQFVALDGHRVVGATTTLRLHFDFEHVDHTFADVIRGGWLTSHEPDGDWLYGADIGIDPGFRNRGLGRALYAGAPGSGLAPGTSRAGDGRDDFRLRRREAAHDRRRLLRWRGRRRHR